MNDEKRELIQLAAENERLRAELASSQKFIIDLSHRLRTPLNAICGMTTLAKKSVTPNTQAEEYLDKIDFATRILESIASEIFDLSALKSGELPLLKTPFDFKLLMTSLSSMFFQQCNDQDIHYDITLMNVTEETLIGDSMRLNQVLFAMLGNALAATEAGDYIKLRVAQHKVDKNRVLMHFSVIDTGVGYSELELQKLWEPEGCAKTGVSLAVPKRLVELMDGRLAAKSHKSMGSTFSATIPFEVSDEGNNESPEQMDQYRVLLACSDPQTESSFSELLLRTGVEFTCLPIGDTTMAVLTEADCAGKPYNLCAVDISENPAAGIKLVKSIRKNVDQDKLHIAVIVSDESSDAYGVARSVGADTILPKPLFQSTIFNLLMKLTGKHYARISVPDVEYDFSGHTVLLCEDNELNAELAVELLHAVGLNVDRAENGEEALAIFASSKPWQYQLILMDIRMPRKDGYDATHAIRALPRGDAVNIPIIALTADAFANDVAKAKTVGMNDYLIKPIDSMILYKTIARYLTK